MKIVNGDCIEVAHNTTGSVVIPHVTNNLGAWGSGFVLALSKKWPIYLKERSPEFEYRREGKAKSLGFCQFVKTSSTSKDGSSIYVANMCAQLGISSKSTPPDSFSGLYNDRPLRYSFLMECMREVKRSFYDTYNNKALAKIVCPKFGSDRAGGNWDFITELIEEIWGDMDVTVCCLQVRKKP